MNMLTEQLPNYAEHKGRRFRTCCSFDNVLEVQRLYKDERLTDFEKMEQGLSMLVQSRWLWMMRADEKAELLNQIFEEQIKLPVRPKIGRQIRTLDFALDSEYIYASFMQDYGLDLVELQGVLHWKKFIALFQGLSDKTKIKEIMRIRGMDIPELTKYNQKERRNIMELKSYYALPVEGGGGQQGLDMLFRSLEAQAVRNG